MLVALGLVGLWGVMEWPTGPAAPFHYTAPAGPLPVPAAPVAAPPGH
jgi:hypothetical protein